MFRDGNQPRPRYDLSPAVTRAIHRTRDDGAGVRATTQTKDYSKLPVKTTKPHPHVKMTAPLPAALSSTREHNTLIRPPVVTKPVTRPPVKPKIVKMFSVERRTVPRSPSVSNKVNTLTKPLSVRNDGNAVTRSPAVRNETKPPAVRHGVNSGTKTPSVCNALSIVTRTPTVNTGPPAVCNERDAVSKPPSLRHEVGLATVSKRLAVGHEVNTGPKPPTTTTCKTIRRSHVEGQSVIRSPVKTVPRPPAVPEKRPVPPAPTSHHHNLFVQGVKCSSKMVNYYSLIYLLDFIVIYKI